MKVNTEPNSNIKTNKSWLKIGAWDLIWEPYGYIHVVHGRKGNLTVFESSNIYETGMATPIKIGVHAQYIDLYLHDFFEPILND